MLQETKISLWDVLTILLSGVLIVANISVASNSLTEQLLSPAFVKTEVVSGGYFLAIVYGVGAAFEPISNLTFKIIDSLYIRLLKKFSWMKSLREMSAKTDRIYKPMAIRIMQDSYGVMDQEPYHFAKDFVLREQAQCPYMQFLSKFGLYRNISIIVACNVVYWGITHCAPTSITYWIWIVVGLLLHLLFYRRAREFYLYVGDAIYNNFIIAHDQHKNIAS